MGKLVALNTNNEEKKLKTEQPIATTVAQGRRGKLMQTGSASAPVSSPHAVYRTSPVKTTPLTRQNVVMPKTPTQGGASPMFRQQNVVTPKWQSPIMQGLNSGALQQQNAKPYQSKEALEQHVKDVKPQTVTQRVGNTLKGAAKTYGAGFTNAAGLAQTGSGLQRRGEAEKEIALWDQDIKAQRDVLADPSSTASERDTARNVITALEAKKAAYLQAYGEGGEVERTAGNIYKAADRLADSGAKDISKAKRDLGGAGRLAVDVGVAGAQMGMDAALGLLTGGSALPAMFVRSAGGSAQEARRAGATHEQQVNYGLASGALSVATEKIGNAAAPFKKMFGKGFLDDVIDRTMHGLNRSAAGKIALSFLEEGGEEAIEDLIQPALQTIYNGKTLGGSYSELEASEILNDFLVGGILGGLGGGVEAIGNRGGRYYDSRTELPKTQTETRSDAEIVNSIADRLFARYDSMIGESGRKAIRGSYQEGKDTAQHGKDFIPAYNAGVEGKANPNPTNETAYAGYVAGQNDAKAEARKKTFAQENDGGSGLVYDDYVSREMDNATADEINTVAKALGVRVRMADVVRGGTANGVIEGNEIRIAKDAQDPVMQVVGHEWTHRVQELAPEQYTAFRDAIMEDPDVAEAANILHEQYNRMGVEISADEAMDEAAANYAGEMIANTDVLNEFIRRHSEDRTLLEKLRDAIREIVGKLAGKAKQQAQTAEGLLQQAFEAAAQNSKNAATEGGFVSTLNGNEETTYSIGNIQKRKKPTTGNGSSTRESGALNGGRLSENSALQNEGNVNRVDSSAREGDDIKYDDARYSLRVTDKDTLDYLDGQKTVKTYKTMQLVDGKLYPPMAARVDGKDEDGSELGAWEMAVERPGLVKNGKFKLDKGKGQGSLEAAYNPYMHSSNLVINDQFSGAYARNNLVTVECEVPVSEDTSGYHADGAKDSTGWHSWHTGTVAGQVRKAKGIERKVFLSRWIKPVRILSDAEVAGMYKELLGGTDIAVPDNVVTPGLLAELKKAGVPISESGRLTKENGKKRYSLKTDSDGRELTEQQQEYFKDSKVVDSVGQLKVMYRGGNEDFTVFDRKKSRYSNLYGRGFYFTDSESHAKQYGNAKAFYLNITAPVSTTETTITRDQMRKFLKAVAENEDDFSFENYGYDATVSSVLKSVYGKSDFAMLYDVNQTAIGDMVAAVELFNDVNGTNYDGLILDTEVVAFRSNQIKNIDNKAPTRNPDIRQSLKGTENAQEIAALKRENETLRERVDYWKRQTRRSDGVRTDSKSVEKAAKELTHRYGAEIDGSEIAGDLANLYDYIARGGDETGELTYTEARSRADSIAQRIAESAIAKDDEAYREYSELRKYLKDTKITLSAEDAAGITDYADFRRSLFGKVNLGKGEHTNVDQVYSELAESYPEFFSETRENNVSDQITRIADVANELYSVSEYNPFDGYMGQAVSAISNDVMERFFDLPQAKKTFADVQAEKLDAAKAAGRKAAADAKLAGQMAQGRTDAVKLRHTQEALQKARAQQAEKLDALRNRYREKDATRREKQANRELRAKITRHAKDLSKKLLRPTDTKHIPENMRSAVAAVLNSINQESAYTVDESGKRVYDGSGTPTKRTQAFEALRDQYQDILSGREKDGDDLVIDPSLLGTDGKDGLLGQVIGMENKRLSELTREELGTMWKAIRAVEKSVSTAGKVLSKSKFETTKQMADAFKADVSTRRKKLGNNTTISLETPYTFFAHYGETGKSIYRMLRNAQDSQEIMARDIAEKTRKVLGDELGEEGFKDIAGKAIHGDLKGALRDARGSAIGKWEAETHDIIVANGGKLTLTTPQIMELYLLSKRKQALGHLLGGGVIQPEIKSAETGRTKVPRGTQQIFLTDGDIERITGKLTDEQKRVADGLQELTATTLAKYGNDASMQAYGYRKFTEKHYWPIKSAKEALHSNLEKDSGNVRSIKNIGMAQQVTPNANNAVELRSVFDTFADHASDMIDYAAWLAPMEDANRFFNFQYRNDAGNKTGVSVKGLLDEKGGKGAQQYWQKLMGDIQNGIGTKDFEPITGKMGKFVGKFKGASVGANIRVVIQQPTAFFRAAAVLDPKDMAKGMTGGVTKGSGWEKALEHSPIAMRKDVGSFDISSPYTLKDRFYGKEGVTNKLNALAGAAAGKADAATWGKLWNACEWQVKREKPDVRAGSNEFYSAVNDVFSDMIDQTQVVDGILQRSNIMRGKSTLSQQATAFMGEPIMSLNVLLRSYDNFRYEENPAKRSKALKTLGRAATALVVTNVVNALAQSIVDGLRDDDRDKDYWEKFFSAFTGVGGDENNALELIGNVVLSGNVGSNMNPVAQIPFAKDILSLAQGYDVSRPDMEVFSDLINAARAFVDSAGGDGKMTRKEAILTLLAAASKMFGLPAANIKRDLMSTLRTISQASGSLGFQYEVEKFSYNLANSGNKSRFIGILYDALEQGDYATYEHVRRDLMEQMGLDGESIQSSLKTSYNKKAESEANYSFPQKSLDLLGIRGKYAYDSGDDEEKFSAADLNASSYSKYETQKGEVYRAQADKATSSGAFSRLSDEGKDKALGYVESYAEAVALKENSGGQYEITTKWIQNAQEAQKQYRIAPGVFAACKAAASECEMLKDKDGDSIDYSKGLQIMEMLFRSGLNEQQRTAMYEYLDVPKKIRHWNRARVDEQLAIARNKAV